MLLFYSFERQMISIGLKWIIINYFIIVYISRDYEFYLTSWIYISSYI